MAETTELAFLHSQQEVRLGNLEKLCNIAVASLIVG